MGLSTKTRKKRKKKPKGRKFGPGPGAGLQGIGILGGYQEGETSSAMPSILGSFEWARKECQEKGADVGLGSSSMVAGELKKVLGVTDQTAPSGGLPSQTALTAGLLAQMASIVSLLAPTVIGGMGFSVEHCVSPVRPVLIPSVIVDPLGMSTGVQLSARKSWVAGRTRFGPVDSRRVSGLSKSVAVIKVGVGSSAPVVAPQFNDLVELGESGHDV
jgi:hypothetical protein